MDDMIKELETMLEGFVSDPADSDFQRGYKAALEEILRVAKDGRKQ